MRPPEGTEAREAGTLDLATFNHWLCITRLRAAGAVALFALVLAMGQVGHIAVLPVLGIGVGLAVTSWVGLRWSWLPRHPHVFFYAQTAVDLAAATIGIGTAVEGFPALMFRPIYAIIVVPASLISMPSGLLVATAASVGHLTLLGLERGFSWTTVASMEATVPTFLFFLVAQ